MCLKETKPDHKGLLYTYERDCLDLVVSPQNLGRALKIYDTLIKACEVRGYAVSVSNSQKGAKTILSVLGENLEIGIRERYTEKTSDKSQGRSSVYQLREYGPSGSLSLLIKNARHAKQKSWNDGRCQIIEDCLNDFMEGLVHAAASEKAIREKREREERERRERIRLYEEAKKEQEEEQAKVKKLRQEATDWSEAQRIRNYIMAIKEKAVFNGDEIHPDSDLDRWLTWANQQADRLDPLTESPPSVLEMQLEPPFRWY